MFAKLTCQALGVAVGAHVVLYMVSTLGTQLTDAISGIGTF